MQWDIGGWLVWLTIIVISITESGKSNVEADALSRIDWEKCDENIQADPIQAIVAAAITGDLSNIESILCSVEKIESFLLIQSETV